MCVIGRIPQDGFEGWASVLAAGVEGWAPSRAQPKEKSSLIQFYCISTSSPAVNQHSCSGPKSNFPPT